MPESAVAVHGLRKPYGRVRAVRGIDLAGPAGRVFALLGPNGAGKTTPHAAYPWWHLSVVAAWASPASPSPSGTSAGRPGSPVAPAVRTRSGQNPIGSPA